MSRNHSMEPFHANDTHRVVWATNLGWMNREVPEEELPALLEALDLLGHEYRVEVLP